MTQEAKASRRHSRGCSGKCLAAFAVTSWEVLEVVRFGESAALRTWQHKTQIIIMYGCLNCRPDVCINAKHCSLLWRVRCGLGPSYRSSPVATGSHLYCSCTGSACTRSHICCHSSLPISGPRGRYRYPVATGADDSQADRPWGGRRQIVRVGP